jgi:Amt family ammonium transporter
LIGAGILWIGWNGFNGGDPYAASADAGAAVLNTNVATAMSLLCWTICDMIYFKKPSVLGAVQGMITGLVAITPAAGVVAGWGAICIGFASGTIPVRTPVKPLHSPRKSTDFQSSSGLP